MIEELAEELFRAWKDVAPIEPLTARIESLTIDDAYAVQQRLIAKRHADGARRVGRKVGLTSIAMQEMLGVDQPDFGVILDEMVVEASSAIDRAALIAPRVEPEIAFTLAAALEGDVSIEDVLSATETVEAALEIIDSRVIDWRITIVDTIADNASSALVVLGDTRVAPDQIDLVNEIATMSVGSAAETGRGDAVLGHPAAAVAWLAKTLAQRGERLEAGDVVLPGAMARALPFGSGDVVRCTFSTLGTVEIGVK